MKRTNVMRAAIRLAWRVAPVYELLNWEWAEQGIPDEAAIVEALLELYDNVASLDEENYSSGIGGLKVTKDGADYILSFVIEETVYDS